MGVVNFDRYSGDGKDDNEDDGDSSYDDNGHGDTLIIDIMILVVYE